MLDTHAAVERTLWRFADPLQPRTSCVLGAGVSGGSTPGRLPFRPALLEELDLRTELTSRLRWLNKELRTVLVRWYVEGASPEVIARGLGCSTRHVYRLRTAALRQVVELGNTSEFDDADLAEFS